MISSITLTVIAGAHKGHTISWAGPTQVMIGRSAGCTFRLHGQPEDALVSRGHCLIDVRSEWIEIRDLESCNGTYVNGQRLGFGPAAEQRDGSAVFKRRLQHGDTIQIGASILTVRVQEIPGAAQTAKEGEASPPG
jgi:pSer/pThr/pTyr-binding forkhead associated (FHA) protein